ncbi:MAG: MraY family glycosyltransferase [Puniceicoccales bacterium]
MIGLVFSAVVSIAAIIELRRYAPKLGIIDEPDHRKVHTKPIARIGGLGLIAGFFAGVLYFQLAISYCGPIAQVLIMPDPYLLTGAIAIAVTGLVDDLRGINFRQKLVVQCLVATYMILAGARLKFNFFILPGYAEAVSVPVTFFWIIGVTNAVNLIDGLDGLAGGVFLISLFVVSFCTMLIGESLQIVLLFCMVGAVLGFLFVNWHPAKVFMGDSGSLFLGYIIAIYSLNATVKPGNFFIFLIPVFAVGLPVFDTLLSMGRRALKGRPLFYPDKDHIHHRIQRVFGYSQRVTVYCLYGINMVFGAFAIALTVVKTPMAFVVVLMCAAFFLLLLYRLEYLCPASIRRYLDSRKRKKRLDISSNTLLSGN